MWLLRCSSNGFRQTQLRLSGPVRPPQLPDGPRNRCIVIVYRCLVFVNILLTYIYCILTSIHYNCVICNCDRAADCSSGAVGMDEDMAQAQRKPALPAEAPEAGRKPRTDPQRLKAFAKRLNLMLGELGLPERGRARLIKDRVGVSGTTAANWLRGWSYPSFEELGRIGRLGVDPTRLFPDKAELARMSAQATLPSATVSKRLARLLESAQLLPLSQLKTGDGEWDHTALPNRIWQQLLGRTLDGFVLLCMQGDAMGERIKDGTPLLVDTNLTQITEDNGIYALLLGKSVIVRRVQRRLHGGYVIACDNPAIASETIDRLGTHHDESAKAREVLVLGRVALAIQKL